MMSCEEKYVECWRNVYESGNCFLQLWCEMEIWRTTTTPGRVCVPAHALDAVDRGKWQTSKVCSCILCKLGNQRICGDCGPCMSYVAGLNGPCSSLPIMAAKSPFPSECSSDRRLCLLHLLLRLHLTLQNYNDAFWIWKRNSLDVATSQPRFDSS